jgi:short-subunit dehydrogenase
MPRLDFTGRLVVVTGASSGLGREIALSLALREKADVVIAARRQDRLEALKAEIESRSGSHAHVIAIDLGDAAAPQRLFKEATALGQVSALVNCAGITFYGRTLDASMEECLRIVTVNQVATMQITMLFLGYFLERGAGAILSVTSVSGVVSTPFQTVYSASKHAVQTFMEGLSREYRGRGVSICTFAAASMATEMITKAGLDRRFATGSPVYLSLVRSARYALSSFKKGKLFSVPGWMYKTAVVLARLVPRRVVLWAVERFYAPRTPRPGASR